MARLRQQGRIEADDIALAFQHRTLEIVVQRHPCAATPSGKCLDVTAQEVLQMGAHVKAQDDLPRPGQHRNEAHQGPLGAADFDVAEMAPVNFHLLARQGTQAQIRLASRPWPMAGDQVPEVIRPAGIATLLDNGVEPTGT